MSTKFIDGIKPKPLKKGDTIGVFTPSTPGYIINQGLFENGIKVLQSLGFNVKQGNLTENKASQGYRSGTPKDRANEFMELIVDPEIDGLISTIGGYNSSSLIPYLDFDLVKKNPKVVCGYSDISSLHLALLHYTGLSTFYGPSLMTWIGEYPEGEIDTINNFLNAVTNRVEYPLKLTPPLKWSNHRRRWDNEDWKYQQRQWKSNEGWRSLRKGLITAPIIISNLSTLVAAAGTPYFPSLKNKILLIEEETTSLALEERHLRHLELMGIFDQISGLLISKPENLDISDAPFSYDQLILEILDGHGNYPIASNFDCGHTVPSFTIAQNSIIKFGVSQSDGVSFTICETMTKIP